MKRVTLVVGMLLLFFACNTSDSTKLKEEEDIISTSALKNKTSNNLATVIVFLLPDCPASQNYSLTLNQLSEKYKSKRIKFFGVFPSFVKKEEIIQYQKEYQTKFQLLMDESPGELMKTLHAHIAPEVFVLDQQNTLLYSGRIDDWMYAVGKERTVITHHELQDALEAIVAGEKVAVTKTEAVGCIIDWKWVYDLRFTVYSYGIILVFLFSSCIKHSSVTYSEHIAPIIYKHCTPCHRPGSAGTFNLITYEDVKRRAKTIELVTRVRSMPPWPADPAYSHFRDEKMMNDTEINLIRQWVEDDSPIGESEKVRKWESENISKLNSSNSVLQTLNSKLKPDLVLHFPKAFFIEGNNKDHFMMMKIPFELPQDTFVRAIEIVPGNRKLVHHINAHLIQYDYNAKKDLNTGETAINTEEMNKLEAFKRLDLANDDGSYPTLTPSVTNYLPGVEAAFYPAGIGGYRVKRKCILLLDNIHYGPSPVDTTDSTTFNVFFNRTAPRRPTTEFILGTSGISKVEPPLVIQPNTVQKFKTEFIVPTDISILTINPHMHLLGKSFIAYAVKPGGDTIKLIRIPNWNFRWQYFYTFQKMLKIPKGTTIYVGGVYDNTSNNPLNPFHPPQIIAEREGSMRTTDEMFQFIVTYTAYQPGDENINLEVAHP